MLAGLVMVITVFTYQQDTTQRDTTQRDSVAPAPAPTVSTPAVQVPPAPPPPPTIEQIRFMDGLRTASRGIAQIQNGLDRVVRTQQSGDSVSRRRAARRMGGLCGSGRSFIASGRPKMQATAYEDTLRVLARQLTVRLDSLARALPVCERTAGSDPKTVVADLTKRLQKYEEALLAFRNAQKPDSTREVSQQ